MKLVYRIAVVVALAVLAAGTAIIACELRRLNTKTSPWSKSDWVWKLSFKRVTL